MKGLVYIPVNVYETLFLFRRVVRNFVRKKTLPDDSRLLCLSTIFIYCKNNCPKTWQSVIKKMKGFLKTLKSFWKKPLRSWRTRLGARICPLWRRRKSALAYERVGFGVQKSFLWWMGDLFFQKNPVMAITTDDRIRCYKFREKIICPKVLRAFQPKLPLWGFHPPWHR